MDITSRGKKEYLPRILKYRKQIKIADFVIKYYSFFSLLISFISLTLFLFLPNTDEAKHMSYLWTAIDSWLAWLILHLAHLFFFKPLVLSKIQVYKDKIFISQGKKEITIPFNEVKKIKSIVIYNCGGWFTIILKNKKKYRFTGVLERSDYILDALIQFNPKLMEKEKYEKLREQLILGDHGLARLYELFKRKYRLITLSTLFLLPISFLVLLFYKQSNEFIIHSPLSYFLKFGILLTSVLIILWWILSLIPEKIIDNYSAKQLKNKNNKKRDTSFEYEVHRKFFYAYMCIPLIMFFGVYKTNINTLGTAKLQKSTDSGYLNIKPGKLLWYDSRFNCISCNYPLNKGDIVVVRGNARNLLVGKIVGLPNEIVAINKKNKKGRFIASTKKVKVSSKSIALQTSGGKVVKRVELKKIKGKILKNISQFFNQNDNN